MKSSTYKKKSEIISSDDSEKEMQKRLPEEK